MSTKKNQNKIQNLTLNLSFATLSKLHDPHINFNFLIGLAIIDSFTCLGMITLRGFPSFGDNDVSAFGSTISWVMIPITSGGITWTGGMFITVIFSCELYIVVCHHKIISRNERKKRKVWQYWLWSFQGRDTKLERFWLKVNCSQMNLENWSSGELSKSAFKVNFSLSKSSESFWFHFFIETYEFRSTFLGTDNFLITLIFKSLYFLKWCQIFDS